MIFICCNIEYSYTYSFSFFNISVAMTRELSQSDGVESQGTSWSTYRNKSHDTTPKDRAISIFLKQLPSDENGLFVTDEPTSIKAISSLLSVNNYIIKDSNDNIISK